MALCHAPLATGLTSPATLASNSSPRKAQRWGFGRCSRFAPYVDNVGGNWRNSLSQILFFGLADAGGQRSNISSRHTRPVSSTLLVPCEPWSRPPPLHSPVTPPEVGAARLPASRKNITFSVGRISCSGPALPRAIARYSSPEHVGCLRYHPMCASNPVGSPGPTGSGLSSIRGVG